MEKTSKLTDYFIIGILLMMMFAAFSNPNNVQENGQRDLSLGKIGGDVRRLQITLDKKGYNLEPFNGIYGFATRQAVIDLQRKNHLKQTGIFDHDTRQVLRNDHKKKTGSEDVVMLARVIHGEARGEPFEGKVAVAAVILNRTRSGQFPHTVTGVVFEPGAFDAVDDGQIWLEPDDKSVRAAELALAGYDPTGNALYYWNPAKSTNRWIWSRPIVRQIGGHVFAK